ncbi:MAG: hypothetical protein ACK4N5_10750 [Myxococcales bacterium]
MRALLVVLAVLAATPALAAEEDHDADLRDWPVPFAIVKAGVGIPGVPSLAAELFVREWLTLQLEGGNGPIGAFGAVSARYRPCWRCERGGPALALGIGPELTVIPFGEDDRTGIIATILVEPAFVWRFTQRFGAMVGLKLGVGPEWDFKNGAFFGSEVVLLGGLYLGLQF